MSFIFSLIQNAGWFDDVTQGHFDAESSCGVSVDCAEIKDCIYRVCTPNRDAYGGVVYDSCVKACNENRWLYDFNDFACKNPEVAYQNYGITCPGYEPPKTGSLNIFGRRFSYMQIAAFVVLLLIIYLIIKRA